jgi:hypothetical protein
MTKPLLLLATVLLVAPLRAQQSSGQDEFVSLSPFEVSSQNDRGYASSATISGSRINVTAVTTPNVPITLVKKAEALVIEFALSNSADKQDVRNRDLYDSIEKIITAAKTLPGLRVESRQISFRGEDRRGSIIFKSGVIVSFANIAVFSEFTSEMTSYQRVKQIRDLVSKVNLVGDTKVIDGPVSLFVKNPDQYRQDLLKKIFDDLDFVKSGLGMQFEVLPSGLNQSIKLRSCSETEVELWIDYSFTIRSVRELTRPEKQ